jgi:Fic family protein
MSTLEERFKYKVDIQATMTYTEVQKRNGKKYYYRVKSVKKKGKSTKERVYLGVNLSPSDLSKKEKQADTKLTSFLKSLLTKEQEKNLGSLRSKFKKLPKSTFENRYEAFIAKFTYDSNAIEGNTINLQETSHILFENRTPKGKSLREINEVLNHKAAFDYVLHYNKDIKKQFICEIQKLITQNTLKEHLQDQIGKYRTVQVYIRGAQVIPTKPEEVNMQMRSLIRWYNAYKSKLHPLIVAAYFHIIFEAIHPFVDGNGRTGRLLLNYILYQHNFPMINIPNTRKLEYYDYLEKAQVHQDLGPFVNFLYDLLIKNELYF